MTNNDILRRLRYVFDLSDSQLIEIYSLADVKIQRKVVSAWLKKDDDEAFVECPDEQLASFLNGFIAFRRGNKPGPLPIPEKILNNNIILRKLKIAMDFKSKDMLETLESAGMALSDHELSALFRKAGHKHFRECQNQILRNFLEGLRIKFRP
jgi:uncharacterized protein YehS (DUF1456 family)